MVDEKTQKKLQKEIIKYTRRGYIITSQTETSVQMVRPKKFGFLPALLWFLLLGVGILVYIFYYMSKKDLTVYIYVDNGKIKVK